MPTAAIIYMIHFSEPICSSYEWLPQRITMINPATSPSALPNLLILPRIPAARVDGGRYEYNGHGDTHEGGETVSIDSSAEQQYSTNYDHQPSSMTGQLNHSLRAWTEMRQLISMFGQRTIRLGAEEVRSRVRAREDANDNSTTEQDESPPKKRRVGTTSNNNDDADDSSIDTPDSDAPTPDVIADAQQIKRMAIIFSKMRDAHEQFRQELESFVEKAETRSEEELSANMSQEAAQLVKAE